MYKAPIQNAFESLFGKTPQVYGIHPIGGGALNQNYKILSDLGLFFVKMHPVGNLPKLFESEQLAIKSIRKTSTVAAVNPIGIVEFNDKKIFFLDFVEQTPPSKNFWGDFGTSLANLHKCSRVNFGFGEDNYLGSYLQKNKPSNNWDSFYIHNRLMPAVKSASKQLLLNESHQGKFERFNDLAEFAFTQEAPSLLHGNLRRHHVLTSHEGNALLCNPSSYYGHREMDIAMTKMSGGFEQAFYEAYFATYPLSSDWEIRLDFCQIYYELVNLCNYGAPYLPAVEARLNKWV